MSGTCFECGSPAVHQHHVIPESYGGTRTLPLCRRCHGLVHRNGVRVDSLGDLIRHAKRSNGASAAAAPQRPARRVSPDARADHAPPEIARTLRALRCDGCGDVATTIHLVEPTVDLQTLACNEVGSSPGVNAYPQRARSVALAACAAHDPCGYWFEVDRAVDEWFNWLQHLAGKRWRGDRALLELVERGTT